MPDRSAPSIVLSRGLAEIVLIVKDVRASARFYREVVALEPETDADDAWAWFWAGPAGQPQRLALHKGPLGLEEHSPRPPGERFGQVHFALNVPREKLEQAAAHVRSFGIAVYGPVNLRWMNALAYYFYDPDGNLLEFWSPDPRPTPPA